MTNPEPKDDQSDEDYPYDDEEPYCYRCGSLRSSRALEGNDGGIRDNSFCFFTL